jgi:hypothetical protein
VGGLVLRAVLDGVGVAISPLPVIVAIAWLSTRRPLINSLCFVLGWTIHLALLGAVLLAAVGGEQLLVGADLTRPLAVVLLVFGIVLVLMAVVAWRGGRGQAAWLLHVLGRLDRLTPRMALLAGFLSVSLNAKNAALTLSTVHAMESAHVGAGEGVAIAALFLLVATLGVAGPLVLSVLLPGQVDPLLAVWRVRLAQHSQTLVAWALLGAGALLNVSAFLTLRG